MRIEVTSEECMQMRTSATHCPLTYSGLGVLHYIVFYNTIGCLDGAFSRGQKVMLLFLCTRDAQGFLKQRVFDLIYKYTMG